MEKNWIHIITTGGTIGSASKSNRIDIDTESHSSIVSFLKKLPFLKDFRFTESNPLSKLSENFEPSDWFAVAREIADIYAKGCRRVIITHGTDTMAYSLSAISLCRSDYQDCVVCFTGSYIAPDQPRSDWEINLLGAAKLVASRSARAGVFLAFRENDSIQSGLIIDAMNVKPMEFDKTCFEAAYGSVEAKYNVDEISFVHRNDPKRANLWTNFPHPHKYRRNEILKSSRSILFIHLYPGFSSDIFRLMSGYISDVVVSLYHSGTGSSDNETDSFANAVKTYRDSLNFYCTTLPTPNVERPYVTTVEIAGAGAAVVKDMQAHELYVFLLLSRLFGFSSERVRRILDTNGMLTAGHTQNSTWPP